MSVASALLFAAAVTASATGAVSDGVYRIDEKGWLCRSPGMPIEIDRHAGAPGALPESVEKGIARDGCMSAAIAVEPIQVNVIALQGRIAFVCSKLYVQDRGRDVPSFHCQYVMTKHLRTLKGASVPDQVSTKSPSPTFFNDAAEWTLK